MLWRNGDTRISFLLQPKSFWTASEFESKLSLLKSSSMSAFSSAKLFHSDQVKRGSLWVLNSRSSESILARILDRISFNSLICSSWSSSLSTLASGVLSFWNEFLWSLFFSENNISSILSAGASVINFNSMSLMLQTNKLECYLTFRWLGSLFHLGLFTFVKNTIDNDNSCTCFVSLGGVTTKEIALFVVMTAQEKSWKQRNFS